MATTTIYTSPNCQPCKMTKMRLDKAGISYQEVAIADTEGASEMLRDQGFTSAPVVFPGVDGMAPWSGFDLGNIKALIAAQAA